MGAASTRLSATMVITSIHDVQAGDTLTFMIPGGIGLLRDGDKVVENREYKKKTGRAVMRSSPVKGWVVNGGGRHGTPYVVSEENFVHATRPRKKT